jgi:import receptor subunit TOM70
LEKRKSQNTRYGCLSSSCSSSTNDSHRVPPNVLSYVNKGLALYQWKQDIHVAEECCREALKIDTECEAAVATIAQLSLQQGKIVEAAKMFERHAELARTEPELHNALTYQYATLSQAEFLKNYPDMAEELSHIAQNMTMMG